MDAEQKNPERENLDRWLDAPLRARVDAEPRMGLEDRVLARLAAEHPGRTLSWMPLVAAAAAVIAVSAALILTYSNGQKPRIAMVVRPVAQTSHTSEAPRTQISNTAPDEERTGKITAPQIARAKALKIPRATDHGQALPRLATFPGPSPETEQERLLARLANQPNALDLSNGSSDHASLKVLPVQEFKIQTMEDSSADDVPQE
jgi:hypothetical protein